jgi:hypothetical protein
MRGRGGGRLPGLRPLDLGVLQPELAEHRTTSSPGRTGAEASRDGDRAKPASRCRHVHPVPFEDVYQAQVRSRGPVCIQYLPSLYTDT